MWHYATIYYVVAVYTVYFGGIFSSQLICTCLSIQSYKFLPHQHVKSVYTRNSCQLVILCQSCPNLCSSCLSQTWVPKCVMSKSTTLSSASCLSSSSPILGVIQFCPYFYSKRLFILMFILYFALLQFL